MQNQGDQEQDSLYEGRDKHFVDIDRMVNEGLGGGQVTDQNGLIEETTTDSLDGVYTTDERKRQQEGGNLQ
ncbi:hypothetical protein [Brevibacillus fulvus]|uniref:Uncharacterized protein n=1 Tax=Brevibacillus fulvus TaxID=1125967 RepID=A0A938Y1C8_9BACL|nr:hypothetical protein [Brevibacillus fulvus]MBM7592119.1 hypothetical protein [Brevibacillus fulvus]